MIKGKLNCSYIISKFKNHLEIKDQVVNLVNYENAPSVNQGDSLYSTDWNLNHNRDRKYLNLLFPHINEHMKYVFEELNHNNFEYETFWFQQYKKADFHRWHQHRGNSWTNIYYLEFDKDSPKTLIKDPVSQEIIAPEVEEGDILTFPGFIWHCSPISVSETIKTVIVFNVK